MKWCRSCDRGPPKHSAPPRTPYGSWPSSSTIDRAAEHANVRRALPQLVLLGAAMASATGCHHKPAPVATAPPPPPLVTTPPPAAPAPPPPPPSTPLPTPASGLAATIADSRAAGEFV